MHLTRIPSPWGRGGPPGGEGQGEGIDSRRKESIPSSSHRLRDGSLLLPLGEGSHDDARTPRAAIVTSLMPVSFSASRISLRARFNTFRSQLARVAGALMLSRS